MIDVYIDRGYPANAPTINLVLRHFSALGEAHYKTPHPTEIQFQKGAAGESAQPASLVDHVMLVMLGSSGSNCPEPSCGKAAGRFGTELSGD